MDIPLEYKLILYNYCYQTNNNFAYKFDTQTDYETELKVYNFVPTYDKWCLGCTNKNANYKCSDCKAVYFCGKECQKNAGGFTENNVREIYLHYVLLVDLKQQF